MNEILGFFKSLKTGKTSGYRKWFDYYDKMRYQGQICPTSGKQKGKGIFFNSDYGGKLIIEYMNDQG